MRHVSTILMVLFLLISPAQAGDIFNKPIARDNALPPVQSEQPAPATVQDMPSVPEAMPPAAAPPETSSMPPATQSTETIADFAERYNQNCLKKKDPVLKGDSLRMLCACSASKLQDAMTVEEVKAMMTDTPEGLAQRNRMAVHVYAPCMEYPTRALILHSCKQHEEKMKNIAKAGSICGCMADGMAIYTAANAPPVLAKSLADNPNDTDPLGKFMNSTEFQAQAQTTYMACVQKFMGSLQ